MRAHFTPQAEIDLEEVGDHIALDNPLRAVSFIDEIRQHCEKIADGPHHYVAASRYSWMAAREEALTYSRRWL
jgi:plasmid stabilization system protein ParE